MLWVREDDDYRSLLTLHSKRQSGEATLAPGLGGGWSVHVTAPRVSEDMRVKNLVKTL